MSYELKVPDFKVTIYQIRIEKYELRVLSCGFVVFMKYAASLWTFLRKQ